MRQHSRLEPAEHLLHHLVGESLPHGHQDAAGSLLPITVQLLHPKSHQVDLSLNFSGDTSKILGPQGWLDKEKLLCSSLPSEHRSETTRHSLQAISLLVGALMPKGEATSVSGRTGEVRPGNEEGCTQPLVWAWIPSPHPKSSGA